MAYIVLIALLLSGCFFETSEDLPFGLETDSSIAEIPQSLFDLDEVPTGMVCVHDFADGAACDAVLQDCGEGHYCDLAFDQNVGRSRAVCRSVPTEKMEGKQGDNCDGRSICSIGFLCSESVCKRLCELDTGFGCEEDQFCDDPFPGTHGVCSSSCR